MVVYYLIIFLFSKKIIFPPLNSAIETVNSVIVGKGRYTVNANQEISFQIYDNSVYLISTLMSVYTSRSLAVVFGGNGNQVNADKKPDRKSVV